MALVTRSLEGISGARQELSLFAERAVRIRLRTV